MKESTKAELLGLLYSKRREFKEHLNNLVEVIRDPETDKDYLTSSVMMNLRALLETDELITKLENYTINY